jgi:hypothetical protein
MNSETLPFSPRLASIASTSRTVSSGSSIRIASSLGRTVKAPCFGLHEADKLGIVEIRPIFGIFFRSQGAAIRLLTEFFDSTAKVVAELPVDEPLRGLRDVRIQALV